MPKAANNKSPRRNATEEKLRATPFESVDELEKEAKTIRLMVWRKFQEARVIDELVTKPDNAFIVEEWRAGLNCYYGTSTNNIYKIFSEGRGLKLEINKDFTKTLGDLEVKFLEGIVRAGIEAYGTIYLKTKSLLKESDSGPDSFKGTLTVNRKSKA